MPQVWIEKTFYKDKPHRQRGDRAIGLALWTSDKDKYINNVKIGDIIITIIDNKQIKCVSIVKSNPYETKGIDGSQYDINTNCIMLKLHSCLNLTNAYLKEDFLNKNMDSELLKLISETSNTFYSKNSHLNHYT